MATIIISTPYKILFEGAPGGHMAVMDGDEFRSYGPTGEPISITEVNYNDTTSDPFVGYRQINFEIDNETSYIEVKLYAQGIGEELLVGDFYLTGGSEQSYTCTYPDEYPDCPNNNLYRFIEYFSTISTSKLCV